MEEKRKIRRSFNGCRGSGGELPPSELKPPLTERQKSFATTCGAKIQAPHIVLHFSPALPPVLENDGGGSFGA